MEREWCSEWIDDKEWVDLEWGGRGVVNGLMTKWMVGKKNLAPPSQIGIRFAGYCMWKNNLEGFRLVLNEFNDEGCIKTS